MAETQARTLTTEEYGLAAVALDGLGRFDASSLAAEIRAAVAVVIVRKPVERWSAGVTRR